jgi:hypothetical protein
MRYPDSRKALQVAERFADGKATLGELRAARALAKTAARQAHDDEWEDEARAKFCWDEAYEATRKAMYAADAAVQCVTEEVDVEQIPEGVLLPDLIREIFGNPFQWKIVDPVWLSWNDGSAHRMAEVIYETGSFEMLPILADDLEEAGCSDPAILLHLRGPNDHVRGCWALDLLLAKE